MKYSEIITLAQAGFTAQQIAQMAQLEAASQPMPASVPQPAPAPAITQPTPVPATVQQTPEQLTAILAEMQTLKQTMQAQNRQNAELIPPTPQSAQDILSSIIAPPKTGEK
jgi:hypothetical protein